MILIIYRFTVFSLITISFIISQITVKLFVFKNRDEVLFANQRFFTGLMIKLFGVQMEVIGGGESAQNSFIVANHSSTIDILMLTMVKKVRFITSMEVRNSLFTGILSMLTGTLFIERRKMSSVGKDVEKIRNELNNGFSIALFPEGTTSDGLRILKFKSALFETVAHSGILVIPVRIEYFQDDEFKNISRIAYYGSMTMFRHIMNLSEKGTIKARITFLEPVETSNKDRKEICAEAEMKIRNA
jgi:1-acyl-sn-glycerol-3-phosphate acyltransferase